MSPLAILLLAVAATAAAAPLASASPSPSPLRGVANDLLPEYGLPRGLIPEAIASYTFDNATGDFEIRLESTCYIWFGSHLAYFEDTIRGRISYGTITGLSGIQAQKFFLWVSITTIIAHPDEGTVEFQAGFISEALPESDFAEVPVCGAGAQLRGAAGVIRELGLLPVAEA
ncbi:hypothetical protein E2562_020244 [Oryza meyeriana var. granulata]|uniref:DUF538 family protein n=1 Tax=Oryza meyeriana var. granulata TaxID=110450 RepID=A0A6G1DJU7_9ORYZ|nr:hypothetical protein E2562_020244 [Oryza meyeriana var. granulata]